jgi:hypothetical protein
LIEARIAEQISQYMALSDREERQSWLASYFDAEYPTDLPDRKIVEDIVSGELLRGNFNSMFRCPACGRISIKDEYSDHWVFFAPESHKT